MRSAEGFLSSIDIPARGGVTAGGILIVYPGKGNVTRVRAMAAELGLAAIAVLLASTALSAVLLRLGLGRPIRTFEAIDGAIGDFERGAWRSAAGAPVAPAAAPVAVPPGVPPGVHDVSADEVAGELRQLLDEAEARYRSIGRAIAEAAEIRR